jgi:cysteine desulfurase family protein (TIGR01976 family)
MPPDLEAIRRAFPALDSSFAFLENAGGSQVPGVVADAVREHMISNYVQLGAGYPRSQKATEIVDQAHTFIETLVNAGSIGKVILGPSTTALTHMLANAYSEQIIPGDEVIIAVTNHEANAGPWDRLRRFGAKVHLWPVDQDTFHCSLESLQELLSAKTKLVALPHVSNLLGQVVDLEPIVDLCHQVGAKVIVDGVAYAPHRAIDVQKWGVDWYVFSTYKVYGPHMAALFGRNEALAGIRGPNHFFIADDAVPYKFELGGASHEGCAGLVALQSYLAFLAETESCNRATIEKAFGLMGELESPLQSKLVSFLRTVPDVRVVGSVGDSVGTVSFVSRSRNCEEIVRHVQSRKIGIRSGHMYAYRLCQSLGIPVETGVVRASLVHYNSLNEIDRLIDALEEIL